jgi:hypothetical protein
VEFRFATSGEYHRIAEFLDEYWAKNYVYVRMPELFEWTFARSKLWDRQGYSIGLAEDKGDVVGMLGGIPFLFNCLGRTTPAVWLVNYLFRPDYRRGPIAIRLLSMFSRDHWEVTATSGLNQALIPFFRGLHWQVLENWPRYLVVLPHAVDRMVNLLRLNYPNWQVDRGYNLVRSFTLRYLREVAPEVETILPLSWSQHEWPRIAARTVGAVRDLDYLTWRYVEHPCFHYRVIAVTERERTGLAIWRLETIRFATPRGLEEIDRIGRLVEFLPVSRDNAKHLLSRFYLDLCKANALGADYYGYHGESRGWLRECGFLEVESHPDGWAVPTRFQPLDGKGGRIVNAFFASNELPICSTDADNPWYWTKADGDQDRPN